MHEPRSLVLRETLLAQAAESCLELISVTQGLAPHVAEPLCKAANEASDYLIGSQDPDVPGQCAMDGLCIFHHAYEEAAGLPHDVDRCCKNVSRKIRDVLVAEVKSVIRSNDRALFLQRIDELYRAEDTVPRELRAQLLLAWHKWVH